MKGKNQKVDWYFEKDSQWKESFEQLRRIILASELQEALKWGHPCYTFQGTNVVLIHGFKAYCALLFHKGVLLQDPEGLLIQQTENVQAARQLRFTHVEQILDMESIIRKYIDDAIIVEQSGQQVEMKETSEFPMPEEFRSVLENNPDLKTAFEALTPGRQRGYLLYFSQAKQSGTRESRIEKYIPQILKGKGLND